MARFDRTIPPGAEGTITVEVKTARLWGNIKKSARVFSNDPERAQITIGMKGTIWAPIDLTPRYANLKGVIGEAVEAVVHLRGRKKEALVMKVAAVSIPDKVAVELKELENGHSYELKVKNKAQEGGKYTGQVKLTTNYPEMPELIVRVRGIVKPLVEVKPTRLSFGPVSEERLEQLKKKKRPMQGWVTVALNKGEDFKVNKVEVEGCSFKALIHEKRLGQKVHILVEPILEKLQEGLNEDRLKIYTNQKGHDVLEVPINFEILKKDKNIFGGGDTFEGHDLYEDEDILEDQDIFKDPGTVEDQDIFGQENKQ